MFPVDARQCLVKKQKSWVAAENRSPATVMARTRRRRVADSDVPRRCGGEGRTAQRTSRLGSLDETLGLKALACREQLEGRRGWQCGITGSTRLCRQLRVKKMNCKSQPERYLRLPGSGRVGAQGAWVPEALLWIEEPVEVGFCDFTAFVGAGETACNGRRWELQW